MHDAAVPEVKAILEVVISKKRILLWTILILGVVLAMIAAKYLIGRPRVTIVLGEPVSNQTDLIKVVRVIDGDTIEVEIEGKVEVVRLIGIDSPEMVDPRKTTQCFAKQSSDKAGELLEGEVVSLIADETQGDRDIYGRLLRYIFLDEANVNRLMVEEGFAREYTFKVPYKYQSEFKQAQVAAKEKMLGLWEVCK